MKLNIISKFIFFLTICLLVSSVQAISVFAAEEQAAEEEKELKFTEKMAAILFQESDDSFVYKREGRSDPFVPFVQERVVATEVPVEELTGMRKFEPGQLNVVAILEGSGGNIAMVEDSNKQGYMIRKGVLLGRTGVVEDIVHNKILVKNYTYNLAGDKIYKTVEMVLRQEGEK
jgi:type IV pilus assembly protein PilP